MKGFPVGWTADSDWTSRRGRKEPGTDRQQCRLLGYAPDSRVFSGFVPAKMGSSSFGNLGPRRMIRAKIYRCDSSTHLAR